MAGDRGPQHIAGLDGLRAVAFLLVFVNHVGLLHVGWCGVWLFFLISGYLITRNLLGAKPLPAGRFFGRFYLRRALRILPLYASYVAAAGLLATVASRLWADPQAQVVRTAWPYLATFTFNLWRFTTAYRPSPYISHLWSLCFEEQFYLVWPLLVFLVPVGKLRRAIPVLIVLGPVVRAAGTRLLGVWHVTSDVGALSYFSPLAQVDAFAWGALLNFVRVRSIVPLLLSACALLAGGGVCVYLDHGLLRDLGYPALMRVARSDVWGYVLFDLFFFLFILRGTQPGRLQRFLETPVLRRLGQISYGLYLFHLPLIIALHHAVRGHGVPERLGPLLYPVALGLCAFPLTLAVATLSYRYLEQPCLRLKDRLSTSPERGVPQGTS